MCTWIKRTLTYPHGKYNFVISLLSSLEVLIHFFHQIFSDSTFSCSSHPSIALIFCLSQSFPCPPLCCTFSTCSCSPQCLFNPQLIPNRRHIHLLLPPHPADQALEPRKAANSACRSAVMRQEGQS